MEIMTPELVEICGIHAGDGYMRFRERNKGEVDISGHVEEKDYYDNHVIPLFKKAFNLKIKGRFFSRGTYGFITHKRVVRKILKEFGFPSGKKSKDLRVPEIILNSENEIFYTRFLRGLLDTDGHIGFQKKYGKYNIQLTTISKKFAKDIALMLNKLKIKYFIHGHQPKDPRDNHKYRIILSGIKRLEKWMSKIGSRNPVKFTRYLIWKKFGFCPTHTTLKQREDILKGKMDIYSIKDL
jgi:hypothetical protein